MKFSNSVVAALLSAGASAFPAMPAEVWSSLAKRQNTDGTAAAKLLSANEKNCGPTLDCPTFNAEKQAVSITGEHAYQDPTASDIRGPCPGLNAAANHGYLPRSGVASITETIVGMKALYGMSLDLAAFLAAYAVVFDGDVVTETWSIGGPPPFIEPVGSLLTPPQGISYSHNKYEGDTSIGRNDAYLNNGDAYSLNVTRFGYAFARGQDDGTDRYTADKFRLDQGANIQRSIENNPYYFTGIFSTTLVVPAAYNFVINFMSNHSEEETNGYLNGAMFKEFFAVKGDFDPSASDFGFTWLPGKERIPKNWYRRPEYNPYSGPDVFADLARGWAAYPDTFRLGGNTDGTNTYEGVDIASLTGGTYTDSSILSAKNFGCLIFQAQQEVTPDELKGGINAIAPSLALLAKYSTFLSDLECPSLAKYDSSLFDKYPGKSYSPTAPSNNQ